MQFCGAHTLSAPVLLQEGEAAEEKEGLAESLLKDAIRRLWE